MSSRALLALLAQVDQEVNKAAAHHTNRKVRVGLVAGQFTIQIVWHEASVHLEYGSFSRRSAEHRRTEPGNEIKSIRISLDQFIFCLRLHQTSTKRKKHDRTKAPGRVPHDESLPFPPAIPSCTFPPMINLHQRKPRKCRATSVNTVRFLTFLQHDKKHNYPTFPRRNSSQTGLNVQMKHYADRRLGRINQDEWHRRKAIKQCACNTTAGKYFAFHAKYFETPLCRSSRRRPRDVSRQGWAAG